MSFDAQIPKGWSFVKLSDLGEVNRGRSRHRPRDAIHLYNGPYPFIQTGDVKASGGRITQFSQTYSEAGLVQSRLWPIGTMCITIAANIAETAVLTFPACFPDSVIGFIANEKECNVYFIEFVFRLLRKRIQAQATGSVQDNINLQTLERLQFPIPALKEQNKIAKILGDIDDKIYLNTQTNQTLEQMAQAIFKSWFVDFDPVKAKMRGEQPEGMDVATAALFPDKLVESELGLIPEGWVVKPFKKLIDKYVDNRGKTPPIVDNGIPLVEVKHLPENTSFPELNTEKRMTEETFNTWFRVHVKPKDILISTVGTIGRTSFIKNTKFGIAQNVLGLRFGNVVQSEYMFYTIKAQRFQHDMDARLVTTVQSSIKRKDLDAIDILVPPSSIQKLFCNLVTGLLDAQYHKNTESTKLANLRDTLLPKLLSGEIELKTMEKEVKTA